MKKSELYNCTGAVSKFVETTLKISDCVLMFELSIFVGLVYAKQNTGDLVIPNIRKKHIEKQGKFHLNISLMIKENESFLGE